MNFNKFTIKAQEAVQAALELAQNQNHQAVEPVHLLKALVSDTDNVVVTLLNKLSVPLQPLNNDLDKTMRGLPVVKGASVSGQYLSNATREVFDRAQKQAGELDDEYISSEHLRSEERRVGKRRKDGAGT